MPVCRVSRFLFDTVPVECVVWVVFCPQSDFMAEDSSLASLTLLRWLVLSCMITVSLLIFMKWSLSAYKMLKRVIGKIHKCVSDITIGLPS